jgi:TrpR-related protein YerC/YecD
MKDALYAREDVQRLCAAFVSCADKKQVYAFMRDVMTENEVDEFANRLTAAVMLTDGKSYDEIAKVTAMSTTTIARVSKWLQQGNGGYKKVIAALHHHGKKTIARSGVSLK